MNLTGATATVPSLEEVINPALSWQENNLGNKFNEYIKFSDLSFDSGVFTASESGELNISYLFDGGGYQGDLALVNLEGLNAKSHSDFVKLAAERALSNSELGYVVIKDKEEGSLFDKPLGEKSRNSGEYLALQKTGCCGFIICIMAALFWPLTTSPILQCPKFALPDSNGA